MPVRPLDRERLSAEAGNDRRGSGRSLSLLCGAALPLEAVVIPGIPLGLSVAAVLPASAAVLLLVSGRGAIRRPAWNTLTGFNGLIAAGVMCAYAAALWNPISFGASSLATGWLRAPAQVVDIGVFLLGVIGLSLLCQRADWRRRLLGGFSWSVLAVSAYAVLDFVLRLSVGAALPQIGNDPVTADRRLASFGLEEDVVPRVSGSSGEPKGFAWILVAYLVVWILLRHDIPTPLRRWYVSLLPTAALFATFSASGWIMAVAVLPPALIWATGRRGPHRNMRPGQILRRLHVLAVVVLSVLALQSSSSLVGLSTAQDILPVDVVRQRLDPVRFERPIDNMEMAVGFVLERPWGWGLGNYYVATERETGVDALGYAYPGFFLHAAVEAGVVGLSLFVTAFVVLARSIVSRWGSLGPTPPLTAGALIIAAWLLRSLEVGGLVPLLGLGIALTLVPDIPASPRGRISPQLPVHPTQPSWSRI